MKKINIAKIIIGVTWILLIIIGLSQNLTGFLTVLFFSTIILGPFYCGWLCPFGFIQNVTNNIAKKANIKQIKIPKRAHNVLKYLKYVLFVFLLFPAASFLFGILKYDPRGNFEQILKSETIATASIIAIILFLFISLFNNRFFCKYLCIEGAKYSVFSFGRIFNIKRTSSCVECGKCTKACPMQIDIQKQSEVKDMTCINCMDCVTSCNIKDAIVYKPNIDAKKIILLSLSVILLVGYILYSNNSTQNISDNNDSVIVGENTQEDAAPNELKVLTGSAQGFRSTITVEVSMNGEEISDIQVVDHNDDIQWFNQAVNVIDDMLKTQSTDVDTVSGATYSSQGIINATKDALGQNTDTITQQEEVVQDISEPQEVMEQPEESASIENSDANVLTGTAQGFRGDITVDVTMSGDEIVNIEVTDHQDDYSWFMQALSVIDNILDNQSTDVDTVSGATYSSQGIINATKDALGQDFDEQIVSGGHGKGRGNNH